LKKDSVPQITLFKNNFTEILEFSLENFKASKSYSQKKLINFQTIADNQNIMIGFGKKLIASGNSHAIQMHLAGVR
jgi:hypothetical protein